MKTELEIGKTYNSWTVLKFDGVDDRRRRRYSCRCECGHESSLVASAVFNGRTKHCSRCKASKLTGRQLNYWTVLRQESSSEDGKSMWLCRCKCGKECVVLGTNLTSGKSKCCFDCGHNKCLETKAIPATWWAKMKQQASNRKIDWLITEQELLDLLEKQDWKCALTDLPIGMKPMTASLDRVDSNKPYVCGNIQWVHKHINMMKYRYTQNYFVEMCCLVARRAGLQVF